MQLPQAVLLDLDGTLVDSAPELALAVNEVRSAFGLRRAHVESVRDWVGEGVDVLLQRALSEAADLESDADARRSARATFDDAYARVLGTRAVLYPDVAEGLERLHRAEVALACVTNKPEKFASELLAALEILGCMDLVVGGDTTGALKPDPLPVQFAAKTLGASVGTCLLIGDSGVDIATARNAGCPVWCVRSGYDGGQPVDSLGADTVFDGFGDVVDALLAEHYED